MYNFNKMYCFVNIRKSIVVNCWLVNKEVLLNERIEIKRV